MTRVTTHTPSLATAWWGLLQRDLRLGWRQRSAWVHPPGFFLLVILLFPLGIGPTPQLLTEMAPGIIWVAALLAHLLALERLFLIDYEDGSLDHLLLSPHPLAFLVLAKIIAHWVLTGVPLLAMAPLLSLLLHLPSPALGTLVLTLLIGTPIVGLVGAIGAALTVGLARGGMLLTLVVLPLYVPILIFSTMAIRAATIGLPINGYLALLTALLILAFITTPLATAAALRIRLR